MDLPLNDHGITFIDRRLALHVKTTTCFLHVHFSALSPNDEGLSNYGECSITLRPALIASAQRYCAICGSITPRAASIERELTASAR